MTVLVHWLRLCLNMPSQQENGSTSHLRWQNGCANQKVIGQTLLYCLLLEASSITLTLTHQ